MVGTSVSAVVGSSSGTGTVGGAPSGAVVGTVGVLRVRTGEIRTVGSGETGKVVCVVANGTGTVGGADAPGVAGAVGEPVDEPVDGVVGGVSPPAPDVPFDASARITTPETEAPGRAEAGGSAGIVSRSYATTVVVVGVVAVVV